MLCRTLIMKNFIIVLLFIIKQSENDHCKRCDCHIYIRYIKNRKIDQFKIKEIDHVIAENTVNKVSQCSGKKQDTDTVHRTELFLVWNTFQVKIRDQTEYDQRKKHKKDLLSL